MVKPSKRTWQWRSKSVVGFKGLRATVAGNVDGASSIANNSCDSQETPDTRLSTRLCRRGSKILSMVGLPWSNADRRGQNPEIQTNEGEFSNPTTSNPGIIPIVKTTLPGTFPSQSQVSRNLSLAYDKRLGESPSIPSFAHQLSHKLSQTFGNPTIVHRPNLRTRPSLLSIQQLNAAKIAQEDELQDLQDSTSPSSYGYNTSVSAADTSTTKTSLDSFGSPRSANGHSVKDLKVTSLDPASRDTALTPIQEVPHTLDPTLVTAENAASAKIFFETHFSSLLAGHPSPRSLRRRRLELQMDSHSLPEDQRHLERIQWADSESEHLRRTRVLKTKLKMQCSQPKVMAAGYQAVRVLGKGSFGVVRLVREDSQGNASSSGSSPIDNPIRGSFTRNEKPCRRNSAVYAMKVIRKSDMLRNCQEAHLRAERDFLVASEHSRWVVPLVASFQDHTNLYLVMDYMVGGDFLGLLFRKNILKEKHARWYIAEMILCVEETHRSRWIHRDIKPDNFLISASGHLKISDFGLAFDGHWAHDQRYFKNHRSSLMNILGIQVKGDVEDQEEDTKKRARTNLAEVLRGGKLEQAKVEQVDGPSENETILQWRNRNGKRKMAASIVGTSQYMAPEVIRGDAYDGRCDWWSIGIILYECLYGFTPFVCENREDTKAKILDNANSLVFPTEKEVDRKEKVSYEAMELINGLLQEKEHRLSSRKYRLNDWQHSTRSPGQLLARRSDPLAQDYQGNFVYPEDASDIKAHPFFNRTAWDRLHLSRPPFVPDIKGHDDTRYFDEEDPISDVDDASTQSVGDDETPEQAMDDGGETTARFDENDGPASPSFQQQQHEVLEKSDRVGAASAAGGGVIPGIKPRPNNRERKRARDRVLRDKEVGKLALEIRKTGAFLGYTYRRPGFFAPDDEVSATANRPVFGIGRRGVIPGFG